MKYYLRLKLDHCASQTHIITYVAANVIYHACHRCCCKKTGFCTRIERVTPDLRSPFGKQERKPPSFKSSMSREKDPPILPGAYHFFQGALPVVQSSSSRCLSRSVSMGCQKPLWKKARTCPLAARL